MKPSLIATLVEATGPASTQERSELIDSHSSPRFSDTQVRLSSVRLEEAGTGVKVLGRIHVSGIVSSDLCDLTPGDSGIIREVRLRVNDEHSFTIGTVSTKRRDCASFTKPYPAPARFQAELDEVEVSTGNNWFELRATDAVAGSGLTGRICFLIRVPATPVPADQDFALVPPRTSPREIDLWKISVSEPEVAAQTRGGEIHPYYLRLSGPDSLLPRLSTQPDSGVVRGPDGQCYLAGAGGGLDPVILTILNERLGSAAPFPADGFDFESGFLCGFVARGATVISGPLVLERSSQNGAGWAVDISSRLDGEHGLQASLKTPCELPRRIGRYSRAVQATFRLVNEINVASFPTLRAVASMDWPPLHEESVDAAYMGMYGIELLDKLGQDYQVDSHPYACGEIQGRTCLALLACVIKESSRDGMSKIKALSMLQDHPLFGPPADGSLLARVIAWWKSLPF